MPPPHHGPVTWIHIGDLHMVRHGERNFADLQHIVTEINALFAGHSISFVYLPGDNADNGSEIAYRAVRACVDALRLPWCAIVGDHDVQQQSFENVQHFLCGTLYGAFTAGPVRFLRLNCFADPRPDSFTVSAEQLAWLEAELQHSRDIPCVLLMHCYPSDLHKGGAALTTLIRRYNVVCVDMGHTHYNELSNDGRAIYCATRSTGQVEEGAVGYSVLSLDGGCFSWHFKRLGTPALVSITSPADMRLAIKPRPLHPREPMSVHVLAWSTAPIRSVTVHLGTYDAALTQQTNGVWSATLPAHVVHEGVHDLTATLEDSNGLQTRDAIRIAIGDTAAQPIARAHRDQDNALGAWPERDLLGTQLGPNKNGKKW